MQALKDRRRDAPPGYMTETGKALRKKCICLQCVYCPVRQLLSFQHGENGSHRAAKITQE